MAENTCLKEIFTELSRLKEVAIDVQQLSAEIEVKDSDFKPLMATH